MKLGVIKESDESTAIVRVVGTEAVDVTDPLRAAGYPTRDIGAILSHDPGTLTGAMSYLETISTDGLPKQSIDDVQWATPIEAPSKILCVAANYREHIEETQVIEYVPGDEASPWFFHKPPSSLNPHGAPIRLPDLGQQIDWEAELAVVIGRRGRDLDPRQVYEYVAGYTVFNDISARSMSIPWRRKQRDRDRFHDWLHGKWFDTFSCVGPWMVTLDEMGPVDDFRIRLELNGEVRQDATTDLMIFTVPTLISFISQIVTLEPGDIIATGTPSGVGKATGSYLRPGDVVTASVDGIGNLTNFVA